MIERNIYQKAIISALKSIPIENARAAVEYMIDISDIDTLSSVYAFIKNTNSLITLKSPFYSTAKEIQ